MTDNEQQVSSDEEVATARHGALYDFFIAALTVFSLAVMAIMLLPVDQVVTETLVYIDTIICFIFLGDFISNLRRVPNKSNFLLRQGGWLDLLGSIPALPLLRIARLARFARILRVARARPSGAIWADFRKNRAQSTLFITVFAAIFFITTVSLTVLQFESHYSDGANIATGGDAFWWAFVTMTTVGYGDHYPTTGPGRFLAMILMTVGVVIFGVLTSYLAAVFLAPDDTNDTNEEKTNKAEEACDHTIRTDLDMRFSAFQGQIEGVAENLNAVNAKLAAITQLLEQAGYPPTHDRRTGK